MEKDAWTSERGKDGCFSGVKNLIQRGEKGMDKRVETGTSDADKKNIVSVREEHSEAEIYLVRLIRKNMLLN